MQGILELCSGTKSVSRVARRQGWVCVSLDIDPRHGPEICCNILDLDFDQTARSQDAFDFVWAQQGRQAEERTP